GEEKTSERIVRAGCSEFRFDDNPVSRSAYIAELGKGTVELISIKNPKKEPSFLRKSALLENVQETMRKRKEIYRKPKKMHSLILIRKKFSRRAQTCKIKRKKRQNITRLFQLYHNERKIHFLNIELEHVNRDLSVTKESLSHHENIVKAKKKEYGMLSRQLQQTEKELKSLEALFNQKRPQNIKAKENTSHHLKKLNVAKKSIKDSEKQCSKQEDDIKALEAELVDLDGAWRSFEKQIKEEILHKRPDIELEAGQLDHYKELKEQKKLHWEEKTDEKRLAFEKRRHGKVEENLKQIKEQIEGHKKRIEKLLDLCHPIHKKYQLAVTKVFGQYIVAMVIATEKTQFPQLKKVIQFVCGNGLVCETVEEARHIAFGGPEKRKARGLGIGPHLEISWLCELGWIIEDGFP
ncbi:hypothetical protein MC885_003356, partial [Smutsia gigantea]